PWNAPIGVRAALTMNASWLAMRPPGARDSSPAGGEHALDGIDDRDGARVELDVHRFTRAFAAEVGQTQRLGHEVNMEARGGCIADRQARAVHGDEALR